MKRYRVTLTTVETFTVKAQDALSAELMPLRGKRAPLSNSHTEETDVSELLDTPAYRVRIVADEASYEHGEYGNPGGAPDCDCAHALVDTWCLDCETQEQGEARINAVIDREGLWGFIVEKQETVDGGWKQTDSCFGFIGSDPATNGMADYIGADVLAAAKVIYE